MNRYAIALIALWVSFSARADREIHFGVYTSDKPTTMVSMFRPILNHLETQLSHRLQENVHIRLQVSPTYQAGIDALTSGTVDFSRMGPASYILSKEIEPDIRLLAMENKKGKKYFYGIICVPKNSTITSVDQLHGQRFAFGNKHSTIGRFLAQYHLYSQGITAQHLATYAYLNRHDKVASAVSLNDYDAGALKESTFKKMNKQGFNLREIARFKNTTKPWIARKGLDDTLRTGIQDILLGITDTDMLSPLKKDGFFVASDSDYAAIRRSIEDNAHFFPPTTAGTHHENN